MKALPKKLKAALSGDANQVFRSMLVLAMGTGVAKAIGLVAMPFLTRLYLPQEFGTLSAFVAFSTILSPVLTLRYVVAFPIPKSERAAINLLGLALLLTLFSSSILFLVIFYFGESILKYFSLQNLVPHWWLVIIGVVGLGFYEIVSMWATRRRAFRQIAKSQFWQMLLGTIVKIGLGLAHFQAAGLLIGQVVQQTGGVASMIREFSSDIRKLRYRVNLRTLVAVAKRYSDYPKLKLPSQFLYVYAAQAPVLLTTVKFGQADAGQLGLTFMALALPAVLISQNVSTAYYGEISALGRSKSDKILEVTKNVTKKMFLLGSGIGLLIFLLSPLLFSLAFGKEWKLAGELARALSIYIPFQFVASPLIMAFNVYNRQRASFFVHFVRAILVSIIFFELTRFTGSVLDIIYVYSVILSMHYVFVILSVFKTIKSEIKVVT